MPIKDHFDTHVTNLTAPLIGAFGISPDDASDLATLPRAILIGGSGDLSVVMMDGAEVTLRGLSAGVLYPIRVARVKATGTTASDIVGLY